MSAPRDLAAARGLIEYALSPSCVITDAITRERVSQALALLVSLERRCASPDSDRAAIESLCAAGKERAA